MKLWLYLTYYLPHIAWDPATVGVYSLDLPPYTVWSPDIVSFDATEEIFDAYNRQTISYDGIVVAKSSTVNVKVTCSIEVKYFPYDSQVIFCESSFLLVNLPHSRVSILTLEFLDWTLNNFYDNVH